MALTDTLSSAADTVSADSLAAPPKEYVLVFDRPESPAGAEPTSPAGAGMSWVITGLFLVFLVACLRFRKNARFLSMMLHDVFEVRVRPNAFDDTLHETAFLWLLNLLWAGCAGVLLYCQVRRPEGAVLAGEFDVGSLGLCMGLAALYVVFMVAAYAVVATLFDGSAKASMWVRGFLSMQGLVAVCLFPLALLALCVPGIQSAAIIVGFLVFIVAKILFIYKGFCIFFAQIASWVLFLYYLCSLEIVPVVLTYVSARYLCGIV